MKKIIKSSLFCFALASLVACNASGASKTKVLGGNASGWTAEERTACQGYYIQTEFTDQEWEVARSVWSTHPGYEKSATAMNTLVLRNTDFVARNAASFTYEVGQRYELTKEFRDTYVGCYFMATFYGTYTYSGNLVTLKSPEKFSYIFDCGSGRDGAEAVSSAAFDIDYTDRTNPIQDWVKGDVINSFNGSIINYRHNSGHDDMTVTIDQENFTFHINVPTEDGDGVVDKVPNKQVPVDFKYGGNKSGWTDAERTKGQGYYVQTQFTDQEWEVARSVWSTHPGYEKSSIAYNQLVLRTNNFVARNAAPFTYPANQQRYELTKQFRDTYIGAYFWATFYGTYEINGNKVTLNEPEKFSYMFDCGAGRQGAEAVSSGAYAIDYTDRTNPIQDWVKGDVINSFNGQIVNYRHNSGHEAMTVTLDQENFTFDIDRVEE